MFISLLCTIGLCALSHLGPSQIFMDDLIPKEEKVRIQQLPNGIKTFIRENAFPPKSVSLRVILKKDSGEDVHYSWDSTMDYPDLFEQFFQDCHEKTFSKQKPRDMAVVAVGDFIAEDMLGLVEKHFGNIQLMKDTQDPSSVYIDYNAGLAKVALGVFYPSKRGCVQTYRDIQKALKHVLLQDLFQQRLERCTKEMNQAWVHPHPRFIYPVQGYMYVPEEMMENHLAFLLAQAESACKQGFFEEEFTLAKGKMIDQLQYLSAMANEPDDAFLASYYADQFLLGDNCMNCQSFLDAAAEFAPNIQSTDLFEEMGDIFHDNKRKIQVVYPYPTHAEILTVERIEDMMQHVSVLVSDPTPQDSFWKLDRTSMAAPTLIPSNDEQFRFELINNEENFQFAEQEADNVSLSNPANANEPFFQLPLNEKEKRLIKIIISTMADKNIIQLALEKRTLEKKGKKVNHVHPLRFIGYILSNHSLKENLRAIKKSSFKWDAFIDGFSKRMREELSNGNIYQHINGFASLVGSTPDHVKRYIDKKDWEGLVKSLL